jgi:hypothetical protein
MRAISTAPIIIEKIAKKARSFEFLEECFEKSTQVRHVLISTVNSNH